LRHGVIALAGYTAREKSPENPGILPDLDFMGTWTSSLLRATSSEAPVKSLATTVLLLAALVLGALILWTIVYNFQDRLSDRELISIAAAGAARSNIGTIAYASADALQANNPGCCIVRHSNHEWLQFPARLYEDGVSVVQMSYLSKERRSRNTISAKSRSMPAAAYWKPEASRRIGAGSGRPAAHASAERPACPPAISRSS